MERAEARLQASIMMSSSIMLSLTGGAVGWMRKTSHPRIDSPTCGDETLCEGEGGAAG